MFYTKPLCLVFPHSNFWLWRLIKFARRVDGNWEWEKNLIYFIAAFIHSFFYVLGTFQCAEDIGINKTAMGYAVMELRV